MPIRATEAKREKIIRHHELANSRSSSSASSSSSSSSSARMVDISAIDEDAEEERVHNSDSESGASSDNSSSSESDCSDDSESDNDTDQARSVVRGGDIILSSAAVLITAAATSEATQKLPKSIKKTFKCVFFNFLKAPKRVQRSDKLNTLAIWEWTHSMDPTAPRIDTDNKGFAIVDDIFTEV